MGKEWYDDLKDDKSEEDRFYEESVNRIRKGVEQGMTFEQAASLVETDDDKLRASVTDDALKVLLAEMHFMKQKPIDEVAKKLRLPLERVNSARMEMLKAVEAEAIEAWKSSQGQQGNA